LIIIQRDVWSKKDCQKGAALLAQPSETQEPEELKQLAAQVYMFAYPLVITDVSRETMAVLTPPNTFDHKRTFPDHTFTDVVSPNADTLYSVAFLDLAPEPMILSVPATNGRYYLMPILDAWTNVFASPGKRTTGTRKADFAISGPRWSGNLPGGIQEFESPTEIAWLIGRTQTNGKDDFEAVNAIQDQYRLTPLSA
jgi:hypothetical protein